MQSRNVILTVSINEGQKIKSKWNQTEYANFEILIPSIGVGYNFQETLMWECKIQLFRRIVALLVQRGSRGQHFSNYVAPVADLVEDDVLFLVSLKSTRRHRTGSNLQTIPLYFLKADQNRRQTNKSKTIKTASRIIRSRRLSRYIHLHDRVDRLRDTTGIRTKMTVREQRQSVINAKTYKN